MPLSVYQHWDPLRVCVVGMSYPPEFYAWIKNKKTRKKFEKLADETEQDYQNLIKLLERRFGVCVLRPYFPDNLQNLFINGKWVSPPTAPRDYFLMIHDRLWVPKVPNASHAWNKFYQHHKKEGWPSFNKFAEFATSMPDVAKALEVKFQEFKIMDQQHLDQKLSFYEEIFKFVGVTNSIEYTDLDFVNGCFVSRIGDNLYFATQTFHDDKCAILDSVNSLFPDTVNRVVNAGGHGDAVYCPVCPGLIISLNDIATYDDTFPDWEVVYLPPSEYAHMREFQASMKLNKGQWFIPGFENHTELCHIVDHYFDQWVGQVSETVFHVNILVIDSKNIVVSCHNHRIEEACAKYGIEVHVSPFRHKYFWDCGIHCITNDLHRDGTRQKWL